VTGKWFFVMADDYEYDIFVSAASESPVEQWVNNHFLFMLRVHLSNEMAKVPKIFWYKDQQPGVHWKENLKKELSRTRILVVILSPHYFRSEWCMAEFESIVKREEMLGLGNVQYPQGLIYPILFSDGDCFSDQGRLRFWKDLSEWRHHWPQFRDSLAYLDFDKAMREVAQELVKQYAAVPPWRADFPIIINPTTLREPKMELPRM
jgi:TIR domain